jgi:hypothetical protein
LTYYHLSLKMLLLRPHLRTESQGPTLGWLLKIRGGKSRRILVQIPLLSQYFHFIFKFNFD